MIKWLLRKLIRRIIGAELFDDILATVRGAINSIGSGEEKRTAVIVELDKKVDKNLINLGIEVAVYLLKK